MKIVAEESLLQKCLHGKTQNHNESFNGMVWNGIPKLDMLDLHNVKQVFVIQCVISTLEHWK